MTRPRCFTAHVKKSTFRDRLAALGALAALASAGLAQAQTSTGDTATPVPKVSVQGAAPDSGPQADGSAVDGYRVRSSTAAGPVLGNLAQLDTPYSINVMPQPLIENFQAYRRTRFFNSTPLRSSRFPRPAGSITLRTYGVFPRINSTTGCVIPAPTRISKIRNGSKSSAAYPASCTAARLIPVGR